MTIVGQLVGQLEGQKAVLFFVLSEFYRLKK